MHVIILAAGQGTRLRPYTDFIPKTMVQIGGKSIIDHQKDVLQSKDLNDINVVVGYKKEEIKDPTFNTFFNPRFDSTNMVASLFCASELFDGKEDILICYGDIVYQPELISLICASKDDLSIVYDEGWYALWKLRMDNPLDDAESFKIDKDGFVQELGKKTDKLEDVNGQYIGMIKISAKYASNFFDLYKSLINSDEFFDGKDFDNMYMTTYLQMLINHGQPIKGVATKNGWLEVDSVEDLETYENLIASGILRTYCSIF